MITHVVLFSFRDGTSPDVIKAFMDDIAHFPERVPAMRRWRLGVNVRSDSDRTYTHAFVVEFDTHAELRAFMQSETHKIFVREHWRPNVGPETIVDFEHDLAVTPPVD